MLTTSDPKVLHPDGLIRTRSTALCSPGSEEPSGTETHAEQHGDKERSAYVCMKPQTWSRYRTGSELTGLNSLVWTQWSELTCLNASQRHCLNVQKTRAEQRVLSYLRRSAPTSRPPDPQTSRRLYTGLSAPSAVRTSSIQVATILLM